MTSKLRVGVIGLGHWGYRAHLPALAARDDVEVVAVVEPDQRLAEMVGAEFQVPRWEVDATALWSDTNALDAVIVATPVDTHWPIVMAALRAGMHVLCEKPLSYDVPQAVEMTELAEATGKIAKMGFLFRFSPVVERMKELVDAGYIGPVQVFEAHTVNAQFIDPARPLHWKMTREHANGGVFAEYGSHAIDLAQWFGGPISNVVAHGLTLVSSRTTGDGTVRSVDVDDASAWIATYASGAEASFRMSWASLPVGGGGIRLYGPRGSLAWSQDPTTRRQEWLHGATIDEPEPKVLLEFAPEFDPRTDAGVFPLGLLARYNKRLIDSFVTDIANGVNSGPSFADGLLAQRVLAAIRTSLDEARWVEVSSC